MNPSKENRFYSANKGADGGNPSGEGARRTPPIPVAELLQKNIVLATVALLTQNRPAEPEFQREEIIYGKQYPSLAERVQEAMDASLKAFARGSDIAEPHITHDLKLDMYRITRPVKFQALRLLEKCRNGSDEKLHEIGGITNGKLREWQQKFLDAKLSRAGNNLRKPAITENTLAEMRRDLHDIPSHLLDEKRRERYHTVYANFAQRALPMMQNGALDIARHMDRIPPYNSKITSSELQTAFALAWDILLDHPQAIYTSNKIFPEFHSIMMAARRILEERTDYEKMENLITIIDNRDEDDRRKIENETHLPVFFSMYSNAKREAKNSFHKMNGQGLEIRSMLHEMRFAGGSDNLI